MKQLNKKNNIATYETVNQISLLFFFLLKIKKKGKRKMKNIDEKILMAEEEIKQLQNKRKKLISQQKQEEKKEIDAFMKKEEYLKVSLPKARTLLKTNFISSLHFQISKKQSIKKSEKS